MRPEPLPPADPAYADVLDTLARHSGLTVVAGPTTHDLLCDLLSIIVDDRCRQAMPADIDDFFSTITAQERMEIVGDDEPGDKPVSLQVLTDVSPVGAYVAVVQFGKDYSRILSGDAANSYADVLDTAVAYAEYDAAVLAQFRAELPSTRTYQRHLASIVRDLRMDRPPLDQAAIHPLRVRTGISAEDGSPFLALRVAGANIKGQIDCQEAVRHARGVRLATKVADLDAAYRRFLRSGLDLSEGQARQFVDGLKKYRHDQR